MFVAGIRPDQPATAGSFRERPLRKDPDYCGGINPGPCNTGFVARLHATTLRLEFLAYLGGNRNDEITALALNDAGNAYISGATTSSDFPSTPGAVHNKGGPGAYAFVVKINPAGTALVYSAIIGQVEGNQVTIAVDPAGNAYLGGRPLREQFPVPANAFQTASSEAYAHGFVAKLSSAGDCIVYSGVFEGTPSGIAVDHTGSAVVTGNTLQNFKPTNGAYQTTPGGNFDAFVMKLNPTGTVAMYATYLSGPADDSANAITLDAEGIVLQRRHRRHHLRSASRALSSNSGRVSNRVRRLVPPGNDVGRVRSEAEPGRNQSRVLDSAGWRLGGLRGRHRRRCEGQYHRHGLD